MYRIIETVNITRYSRMTITYAHRSKRNKGGSMVFTVEEEHGNQCLDFTTSNNPRQPGSKPTILLLRYPGKIISLTKIQTGCDAYRNNIYNLLVLYTKRDENNLFLTVFRISYDYETYMQPSTYNYDGYPGLRLISTIPIIYEPSQHFAQQFSLLSFNRMFPLHPIRNVTFMTCDKRVLLRCKAYGQIFSFLIKRLITSCGIFSHNKKVNNKIELSIASRVFNMMLYMQILKLD
jgi:hypothetical protein